MKLDGGRPMTKLFLPLACAYLMLFTPLTNGQELYTQTGTDPAWKDIFGSVLPKCKVSMDGVPGSKIEVNAVVEARSAFGKYAIDQKIQIHTPGNKSVVRDDFPKWSRWYQEVGNTQVFRLFTGETTGLCNRPNAARVEAEQAGTYSRGKWHEWIGALTVVQPDGCNGCAIFQIKTDSDLQWPLQMIMENNGDVVAQQRKGGSKKIIQNTIGKTFDIKIRDNGTDYEIHVGNEIVFKGSTSRSSSNHFRWGMYMGNQAPKKDLMILFTGANINPQEGVLPISDQSQFLFQKPIIRQSAQGLSISGAVGPVDISIVDMLGSRHVHGLNTENPMFIPTHKLNTGKYLVQLRSKENILQSKLISIPAL